MPTTLTIYPSRWKLIRGLFAGVALTALFVAIIQFHEQWHLDAFYYYLSFVGAPGALIATLYWLVRVFQRKPLLVVNREGIIDTSSAVGVGLVRWDEIAQVTITQTKTKSGKLTYLTIIPHDPKAIIARTSALTKLNEWVEDGKIKIGQVMLPMKVEQLLPSIQSYYTAQVAPAATTQVVFSPQTQPAS